MKNKDNGSDIFGTTKIGNPIFSWCRNLVTVYASPNHYSQVEDMLNNIILIYLHLDFHLEATSE